jgi:hypothetical protein
VTAVLLSLSAFATYWAYPAQPPWLAGDDGLIPHVDRVVPAVWGHLGRADRRVDLREQRLRQHGRGDAVAARGLPGDAAALLLVGGALGAAGARALHARDGLHLVYGGEHFVADIVAGWAMALGVHAAGERGDSAERPPSFSARSRAR